MNRVVTGHLALSRLGRIALRFAACFLVIAACSHLALAQLSMLHTSGRNIVNASGSTVMLKGMNLGGYMVMEPWMCPWTAAGFPTAIVSFQSSTAALVSPPSRPDQDLRTGLDHHHRTWPTSRRQASTPCAFRCGGEISGRVKPNHFRLALGRLRRNWTRL